MSILLEELSAADITGDQMREVARQLNLTQEQVGRLLRFDQSTVSGWYRTGSAPELVRHIFSCPHCRQHFLLNRALLS